MEAGGFEPPNPKERIYSPPRLASSLCFLLTLTGFEPVTTYRISALTTFAPSLQVKTTRDTLYRVVLMASLCRDTRIVDTSYGSRTRVAGVKSLCPNH